METTANSIDLETRKLQMAARIAILGAMREAGFTEEILAERISSNVTYVREVLAGTKDIDLRLLAICGLACGIRWKLVLD